MRRKKIFYEVTFTSLIGIIYYGLFTGRLMKASLHGDGIPAAEQQGIRICEG